MLALFPFSSSTPNVKVLPKEMNNYNCRAWEYNETITTDISY
jgi:hypothetical protein